jgi:glycosyltransferase involved in cell wall biosynthesis
MPATQPRRLVVIIQVPPFSPSRPLGGAEAVAADLANGLAGRGDAEVRVLCGAWPDQRRPPRRRWSATLSSEPAFPISRQWRESGRPLLDLRLAAERLLDRADAVVCFERAPEGFDRPYTTVLGGIAYRHCTEAISDGGWTRLIVPSSLVRQHAVGLRPTRAREVFVVPNGVDARIFKLAARTRPRSDALIGLLASRPDPEKGLERAVRVLHDGTADGQRSRLFCFEQDSALTSAPTGAGTARVELCVLPWKRRPQLASMYRRADVTLCVGDGPEGFGLAAAESVACGTPVLSRDRGFVPQLLPPGHGIVTLNSLGDRPDELLPVLRQAAKDARSRGSAQIHARYALGRFVSEMRTLLLSEQQVR